MGGHAGGQVASTTAITAFLSAFAADPDADLARRLRDGLAAANDSLAERIAAAPELTGMGSTLVAAVLDGRRVTWISVGDTLLVSAHGGRLRRLNADHSMGAVLDRRAKAGEISEREAQESPQRHMLRSAVTGSKIAMIDEGEATLPANALLFAATDGVLTLSEAKLGDIAATAASPGQFVQAVLAEINRDMPEDQDNTTIAAAVTPNVAGSAGRRRGTPRRPAWRVLLATLAFLVVIASVALIALAVIQGQPPSGRNGKALRTAPASSTANPIPSSSPPPRAFDDRPRGIPILRPFGRPTPPPVPAPPTRPAKSAKVSTAPPGKAAAKPSSKPASGAPDVLGATIQGALQQTAAPPPASSSMPAH